MLLRYFKKIFYNSVAELRVFSYVGYEDVLMPIVINKREVITKDVYMKESTKLLEEVVVSAGRFEQKLSDVTVSMDVVKAGDIARQAPTDISSTLRTLPGVDINHYRSNPGTYPL